MIIKERSIINRLLKPSVEKNAQISYLVGENPLSSEKLIDSLEELEQLRFSSPKWGLPELIMPSFREVMHKSMKSFNKIDYQLIHEFGEDDECGILILDQSDTVVYKFGDDKIKIWHFSEKNNISTLCFYFEIKAFVDNSREVVIAQCLLDDNKIFANPEEARISILQNISTEIVLYIAVKKYVKVEVIEVPRGKFTAIAGTPLEYIDKKKIINNTGQKVIVLDSKWFRKIINNNEIFVRGFFRFQNKKDPQGNWYKELIFIDSHVRNGYHRNALIEKINSKDSY